MKMTRIEKWFMNRPQHAERVINRAEKLLCFVDMKGKQNFLEVGCGSGAVSRHIAKKYCLNVTGIDVDPEQIQLAQQNIGNILNIRFLSVDAASLPFQDNDFDIVLSFGVMHHIANWLDALREIRRVLKPGGYLVYVDLLYPELVARFGRSFKHSYGITTMLDLNSFVHENGFVIIHASMTNSLIWRTCEAVYQSS